MGGMKNGPRMMGSSLIGSAIGLVSAPSARGPTPRRIAARPIVAMMTATMGRPMRGRSTVRSSPKPNPIIARTPAPMASHSGAP